MKNTIENTHPKESNCIILTLIMLHSQYYSSRLDYVHCIILFSEYHKLNTYMYHGLQCPPSNSQFYCESFLSWGPNFTNEPEYHRLVAERLACNPPPPPSRSRSGVTIHWTGLLDSPLASFLVYKLLLFCLHK